jgi:hypothetical protein
MSVNCPEHRLTQGSPGLARRQQGFRGRVPPLLLLGSIFGFGCRGMPQSFTAEIINSSGVPVVVEYRSEQGDRDREQVSLELAPGGTFARELTRWPGRAEARISGGDMPYGPIETAFTWEWPQYVVLEDGHGVKVERRCPEPRRVGRP